MRTALLAGLCTLVCACQAENSKALSETRTDSASVEIVAWSTSPWSSQFPEGTLSRPAEVVFESPDPVMFRVVDAAWATHGVLVANESSGQLLFFAEDGSLNRVVGRSGEGPGEFMSVSTAFAWGTDSVGAYDRLQRRLTVFTARGDLARTAVIPAEGEQWVEVKSAWPGVLLAIRGGQPKQTVGTHRSLVHPVLLDGAGNQLASMGVFSGLTSFLTDVGAGIVPMAPGFVFAASGGVVALADGATPGVRLYDETGTLTHIVRWPDHDRALPTSFGEGLRTRTLEALGDPSNAEMRRILAGIPMPDSIASLRDLLVSPEGNVWVGDQPLIESLDGEVPPPAQRWVVLDSTGEFVGRLSTPRGIRIVDVRGDRLLAIHVDEAGSESVRAYSFRWD